jgi:hypothetical protein
MTKTIRFFLVALALVAGGSALATLPSTDSRSDLTAGGETTFTFTFKVYEASSVEVFLNGVKQTIGFTTTLNANQDTTPGGSVAFLAAPAAGTAVRIQRTVPLTQLLDLNPSSYPAKSIAKAFDRSMMAAQQVDRVAADAVSNAAAAQAAASASASSAASSATSASQSAASSAASAASSAQAVASAALSAAAAAQGNAGGNATLITATGTTTADSAANRAARDLWVDDEGAAGDGTTDDTPAIKSAVTKAAGKRIRFHPGKTYNFTDTLIFADVDVDFGGATFVYTGPAGRFAMMTHSNAGSGTNQTAGNEFTGGFTLYQSNFEPLQVVTASTTWDPPSVPVGATITAINPTGVATTAVTVPGALVGGYARATMTGVSESTALMVTAQVVSTNTVVVTLSNYGYGVADLGSGTLAVTVVNNPRHGLCISGDHGWIRGAKVRGFTGVSIAMGSGTDSLTGVTFPGYSRAYYWSVAVAAAPAAGWGLVVEPRSNENTIEHYQTSAINVWGDSVPHRATAINLAAIGGLTNRFLQFSQEASPSEATVYFYGNANGNVLLGTPYLEYNTSWVAPPDPVVVAALATSSNRAYFRHPYGGQIWVDDYGTANDFRGIPNYYVNGTQYDQPRSSVNLIRNGDFLNGLTGWTDFSSNSVTTTAVAGRYYGNAVRVDVTAGRVSLQQDLVAYGGYSAAALANQNITLSAQIRTNLGTMRMRLGGVTHGAVTGDGEWHNYTATLKREVGATSEIVALINETNETGYAEVSNVTAVLGLDPLAIADRTAPIGTATWDPPSLATTAQATTTVAVPGAALGDYVTTSFTRDLQGLQLTGYVSAPDTVTAVLRNDTAGAVDLGSGTVRARVVKQ